MQSKRIELNWNSSVVFFLITLLLFVQYLIKNCSKELHVKIEKVAIENSWKQLNTLNCIYFEYLGSCKKKVAKVSKTCPIDESWLGQPKVNKVKIFLPFLKLRKLLQTQFHAHTLRESQVIRLKKVKMCRQVKIYRWFKLFLPHSFFSLHRYFIETTTTDTDMLLKVLLQFCNNCEFAEIFHIIMLFCPLLDDWRLCRIRW